MTKKRKISLLSRDAKKQGMTFKYCKCCGRYGYVKRYSTKDRDPVEVETLEHWWFVKLTTDAETKEQQALNCVS